MVNRYLLDTHTFLWAAYGPATKRLSKAALAAIEDGEAELYVSSASIYEMTYKEHKGKLSEFSKIVRDYKAVIEELGAKELPISWAHASAAGGMAWTHGDPFDRLLAAQAVTDDLTLITCDAAFTEAPGLGVLWES